MLGLFASPAAGGEKMLTLVYTANSFGKYNPCQTCTHGMLGGLGRRASYFMQMRKADDRAVFISGPFEFRPLPGVKQRDAVADKGIAPALAEAYSLLHYDLMVTTASESQWLGGSGAKAPAGLLQLGDKPSVVMLSRAGLRIGVVLFPESDAPESQYAGVAEAVRTVRPQADMVLGVSSWGERAENKFLDSGGAGLDMLLGSGSGMGYGCHSMHQGKPLWRRPVVDAWGTLQVDVLAKPSPGEGWTDGREYTSSIRWMDETLPLDPKVSAIFSWF